MSNNATCVGDNPEDGCNIVNVSVSDPKKLFAGLHL